MLHLFFITAFHAVWIISYGKERYHAYLHFHRVSRFSWIFSLYIHIYTMSELFLAGWETIFPE